MLLFYYIKKKVLFNASKLYNNKLYTIEKRKKKKYSHKPIT